MNGLLTLLIAVAFLASIEAENIFLPIPKTLNYSKSKALLGKRLFFDSNLSANGLISCSTCHSPINGTNNKIVLIDNSKRADIPTIFNSIFNIKQPFCKCNKRLREREFLKGHILKRMKADINRINLYLIDNKGYRLAFKKNYNKKANFYDMLDALVEFEKSLTTPNAKFDKFLRREIKLTPLEFKGYKLFRSLGCANCHNGINIGGNSFQKIGLIYPYRWLSNSLDRYSITNKEEDKNVYRVPTLRNVELTAPYFHDGNTKTLREAIKKMAYYNLGIKLKRDELIALIAFLKSLNGKRPQILKSR